MNHHQQASSLHIAHNGGSKVSKAVSAQLPVDINSPPEHIPVKSLNKRYQLVSNLGNGSFGSVVLAKRRDPYQYSAHKMSTLMNPIAGISDISSPLVAIKTMNKRLQKLNDYTKVKEVKFILSISSHPNLVFIHEMFIDNVEFRLHIVMETMNQNLYQFMKARKGQLFSTNTVKSILSQILAGIRHIHKHGYFHRDVKPENILISPNNKFSGYGNAPQLSKNRSSYYTVKLADYGLSRSVDNDRPYTAYVSTRWYRSPEILLRQKHYSKPVDIWAFGAVAVEVATFRPLFPGNNELDQTWKILEICGTPHTFGFDLDYEKRNPPLGGYWPDAAALASKLGFRLPYSRGAKIENIISRPDLVLLCDVVKACLTWDPNLRINVDNLCQMPYFSGSGLSSGSEYMSTPSSVKSVSPIHTPKEMMNKSELLTGITPIHSNPHNVTSVSSNVSPNSSKTELARKSAKQKTLLLKKAASQLSPISGSDRHILPSSVKERRAHNTFEQQQHGVPAAAVTPVAPVATPAPMNNQYQSPMPVYQSSEQRQTQPFQYPIYPNYANVPKLRSPVNLQSPGNISLPSNGSVRRSNNDLNQAYTSNSFNHSPQGSYNNNHGVPSMVAPAQSQLPLGPQNMFSASDSANEFMMTNSALSPHTHKTEQLQSQVPNLRNSYHNYSSSIESEGLDSETELTRTLFNQRQCYYYEDPLSKPQQYYNTIDDFNYNQNSPFMANEPIIPPPPPVEYINPVGPEKIAPAGLGSNYPPAMQTMQMQAPPPIVLGNNENYQGALQNPQQIKMGVKSNAARAQHPQSNVQLKDINVQASHPTHVHYFDPSLVYN